MSQIVTLDVPDQVVSPAQRIASITQRRLEDVLLEWLGQSADEVPVEYLSNEQVLSLSVGQLAESVQEELGELLARNREGHLHSSEKQRLDERMALYRRGRVRKAEAIREAVERQLIPPLN